MEQPRKRRNRFICLHGPTQSAASLRAALKPICDQMGRLYEFHFLEAPYITPDEGEDEESLDKWTQAAIDMSRIAALEAEIRYSTDADFEAENRDALKRIKERLGSSAEGKEIMSKAQYEDVENLVSRKTGKSLSRDWVTMLKGKEGRTIGVHLSLLQIGDYMRENGNFHGVIGYDTGASLALLAQSLFSYPRSAAKRFPSFFPQLPKGVKRLPRMGGWEEEPPPPNDPRLGSENLTKDYVPAQRPFELVIAMRSGSEASSHLGALSTDWLKEHPPLISTDSGDSFAVHSITVSANQKSSSSEETEKMHLCSTDADIFGSSSSKLLTTWIESAVASCQGDSSATKHLSSLDITSKL